MTAWREHVPVAKHTQRPRLGSSGFSPMTIGASPFFRISVPGPLSNRSRSFASSWQTRARRRSPSIPSAPRMPVRDFDGLSGHVGSSKTGMCEPSDHPWMTRLNFSMLASIDLNWRLVRERVYPWRSTPRCQGQSWLKDKHTTHQLHRPGDWSRYCGHPPCERHLSVQGQEEEMGMGQLTSLLKQARWLRLKREVRQFLMSRLIQERGRSTPTSKQERGRSTPTSKQEGRRLTSTSKQEKRHSHWRMGTNRACDVGAGPKGPEHRSH